MATNWIHFAFSIVFLFINVIIMILATLYLDEHTFLFKVTKESTVREVAKKYKEKEVVVDKKKLKQSGTQARIESICKGNWKNIE